MHRLASTTKDDLLQGQFQKFSITYPPSELSKVGRIPLPASPQAPLSLVPSGVIFCPLTSGEICDVSKPLPHGLPVRLRRSVRPWRAHSDGRSAHVLPSHPVPPCELSALAATASKPLNWPGVARPVAPLACWPVLLPDRSASVGWRLSVPTGTLRLCPDPLRPPARSDS